MAGKRRHRLKPRSRGVAQRDSSPGDTAPGTRSAGSPASLGVSPALCLPPASQGSLALEFRHPVYFLPKSATAHNSPLPRSSSSSTFPGEPPQVPTPGLAAARPSGPCPWAPAEGSAPHPAPRPARQLPALQGPTTTEQDGTGEPSFSSRRGAQAARQTCDQTLSWICNKFIPEPKEQRKQETETSLKTTFRENAQTHQQAERCPAGNLHSGLFPPASTPCANAGSAGSPPPDSPPGLALHCEPGNLRP